jgi:putative DNA primase/helicase
MGGEARLVTLDIDGPEGRESLAALEQVHGALPQTLTSRSGRVDGGEHRIFHVPASLDMDAIRNRAGKLAPGLDVRAEGGQIAVCPTVHRSGNAYTWTERVPVADVPSWLFGLMSAGYARAAAVRPIQSEFVTPRSATDERDGARYARAALDSAIDAVERAPKGTRNDTLNREAFSLGGLVASGLLSESEVEDALMGAMLNGRWDSHAIRTQHLRTLRRALEDGRCAPRVVPARSSAASSSGVRETLAPVHGATHAPSRASHADEDDDGYEEEERRAIQEEWRYSVGEATEELRGREAGLPALRPGTGECTDLANAEGLVALYGADLRYVTELGGWHHYDGRRWFQDRPAAECAAKDYARHLAIVTGEALAAARTAFGAANEASDEPGFRKAKAALDAAQRRYAWAMRSQGARALSNTLSLASSEPAIIARAADFDVDPWALCCLNGVVDLRTGKLRPHRREDLLTRLAPVVYDASARSELWETFLHEATGGDEVLMSFLSRAAGYSITGDTSEEKLFFVHGPTASGKSTFLEAIKSALGEHSVTSDFETFLARQQVGAPRNDIARLSGSRLVISIEVDDGKRLAEAMLKSITGGDTVTARLLYRESFEFKPKFKLWLAANHAPRVNEEDAALWRRILRIPFDRAIPKEKRNREVKRKLADPRLSGSAILAWAVRGCLAWQKEGLGVPAVVDESTALYRQENDPLREFVDDQCIIDLDQSHWKDVWTTRSALRDAYLNWTKANGVRAVLGPQKFTEYFRRIGCNPDARRWVDGGSRRSWEGVRLRRPADDAMDEAANGD